MSKPRFVLAMGRSGTMWVAVALKEAAGLDARHESGAGWGRLVGTGLGDVEVNSFLWDCSGRVRERFGKDTPIVHLVRDGRHVVRSVLNRPRAGRTVETASEMWRRRNHHLRKMVPQEACFRLEDVTGDFHVFARMAELLGGSPDRAVWREIRRHKVNATKDPPCAPFHKWPEGDQAVFWKTCEAEMRCYGYER